MANREVGEFWKAAEPLLRRLWAEGVSTKQIGLAIGVTKNAVVGRAHRLRLGARPSPIRKDGVHRPRPPRRTPRGTATIPALVCLGKKMAAPPDPPVGELVSFDRERKCEWPLSNGRPWLFCCLSSLPGKPYCAFHSKVAFVKVSSAHPSF